MRSFGLGRKGLALPLVVVTVALVTILGFAAAYIVESQVQMGSRSSGHQDAFYYAEAGVHEYLWHLNKDSKFYEHDDSFVFDGSTPRVHSVTDGYYQLEVTDPGPERPVVTIRSTGWPADDPANRCTVRAEVHKRQFVQHIWLTGQEKTPDGEDVWWITGDRCYGPLHTNGTLNIDGRPEFYGPVTYSVGLNVRPGSSPYYAEGPPEKVSPLGFPPSNSQLMTWAKLDGYYFKGRTCILLNGSQIRVKYPVWNAGAGRYDFVEETRPLPPNGVIYVDGSTSGEKWDPATGNAFVSGTLDGRLTIAAAKDIYITGKDPTNFSYNAAASTGGLRYANNDLDQAGGMTDDMLGLIAAGYVRILHHDWPHDRPGSWWDGTPYYTRVDDVAPNDISIYAAIFALNWAFEFEDYDDDLKGVITLRGSITQKYRGAVGTFYSGSGTRRSGYSKDYHHDPRMLYDTPPHFLEPVNAGWEIVNWRRE